MLSRPLLKQFISRPLIGRSFHASRPVNSTQYYPINDDVFNLTDEQKQVKS